MKFILAFVLVALVFANPFDMSEENAILMKKGFLKLRKCMLSREVVEDPDVKLLLEALKVQNYELAIKYVVILMKKGHAVLKECLDESNGINWRAILECLSGIAGVSPCIAGVIASIVSQCYPCIPGALMMCSADSYVGVITGCVQRFW